MLFSARGAADPASFGLPPPGGAQATASAAAAKMMSRLCWSGVMASPWLNSAVAIRDPVLAEDLVRVAMALGDLTYLRIVQCEQVPIQDHGLAVGVHVREGHVAVANQLAVFVLERGANAGMDESGAS